MIDYATKTSKFTAKRRVAWRAYEQIAPCKIFLPTRPQADFAAAVGNCLQTGHRIFGLDSGNGTGKTTILQNILLNIIYGRCNIYNEARDMDDGTVFEGGFFNGELYRRWPAGWPRLIWYISHGDVLKETITELEKWAIPGTYNKKAEGHQKHPGAIDFGGLEDQYDFSLNGWSMSLKTIDQAKEAFQGANVGIAVIDERCYEWQYNYILRRLRRGGILIHTATPIGDTAYFYDRIVDKVGTEPDKWHQRVSLFTNAVEGEYELPGQVDEKTGKPIVFKSGGKWDLGAFGQHPKGNLPKAEVQFQINNCPQDEIEPVILGMPRYNVGVIYPGYSLNKDKILRKLPWESVTNYPIYRMIIDPHDTFPPAVVWVRIDRFGRRYYFREWPSIHDTQYGRRLFHEIKHIGTYDLIDFCKFFIEIEREWRIPQDRIQRIMDPNFGLKPSSVPGVQTYVLEYVKASATAYRQLGYRGDRQFSFITKVNDSLNYGHRKVADALQQKVSGDMYVTVSPECANMDIALRKYKRLDVPPTYAEKHGEAREGKHGVEVEKKYKGFADLIRYDHVVPLSMPEAKRGAPMSGDDYGQMNEDERSGERTVGADDEPVGEARPLF